MLRIPPAGLIDPATRALRTVLSGTDPLYPVPARVIEAISGDVFGHAVVATSLEPISYEEVARRITDPGFRRQLIGAAIALGMTVHPSDPMIATRIRELAAALDVDEPMLNAFERSVQGHRYWMMADLARHSWASDEIKRDIKESGVLKVLEQIPRVNGHGPEDAEMIERFAALTGYPAGSWGKAVADFYEHYHWPLPGQVGSVPYLTTHHDWVHVAAGYAANPIGELQVSAFMAAQMPDDTGLSVLFWAWSIYETAMLKIPVSPGAVGTMGSDPANPHQVADALRRGRESGVDLLDLDHWAHAARPLTEIRAEFNIGPKRMAGPDSVPAVPTLVSV